MCASDRSPSERVEQGSALIDQAGNTMDQATQQNAALVEEMAASAASLKSQAQELVQSVAVFRLSAAEGAAPALLLN